MGRRAWRRHSGIGSHNKHRVTSNRPVSMSLLYVLTQDPTSTLQREGYILGLTSSEFLNALQAGDPWEGGHYLFRVGRRAGPAYRRPLADYR